MAWKKGKEGYGMEEEGGKRNEQKINCLNVIPRLDTST